MATHRSLGVSLLVSLLTCANLGAQTIHETHAEQLTTRTRPTSGEQPDSARTLALIVEQTNGFRREHQRSPLRINPKLSQAAQYFAEYLARNNKFSHTADGNQPWDRTTKYGYAHCIVAENIAYEYDSAGFTGEMLARKLMEGWENSPDHRKNLLDADVTDIGVGLAHSPETGYYYAVQDFGRPQSQRLEFTITNDADTTVKYQLGERTFPLPPGYTRTHQSCRPAPVVFHWPGDAAGATLRPAGGEHLDVTRDAGGRFHVKSQRAE